MRLSLRFIVPLLITLTALAYGLVPLVDQFTSRWFLRDLDLRATLVANSVQESIRARIDSGGRARLVQFLNRLTQDERLYGVGYCSQNDSVIVATRPFPTNIRCNGLQKFSLPDARRLSTERGSLHVTVSPLEDDAGAPMGKLILVHDLSFVGRRSQETRLYLFYLFVGIAVVVSITTVVVAQLSWRGWVQGMRALMRGEGLLRPSERVTTPELQPVARDLRQLLRDIESTNSTRDASQVVWQPETLRALLQSELRGQEVIVVSNREPYIHDRVEGHIEVNQPASGVVTALEPIMRACSGTWDCARQRFRRSRRGRSS